MTKSKPITANNVPSHFVENIKFTESTYSKGFNTIFSAHLKITLKYSAVKLCTAYKNSMQVVSYKTKLGAINTFENRNKNK